MSELIEREDVIAVVNDMPYDCFELDADREYLIERINDIPSADRPQGEWIYCEDEYGIDGYRCSNCGKHIPWDYQHKFINFIDDYHTCPFCDARMKGADDDVPCEYVEEMKGADDGSC